MNWITHPVKGGRVLGVYVTLLKYGIIKKVIE